LLGFREFAYSPAILIFVGAEMLAVLIICSITLTAVIYWASSHLHQGEDIADRICAASAFRHRYRDWPRATVAIVEELRCGVVRLAPPLILVLFPVLISLLWRRARSAATAGEVQPAH
jgi:hypothetical protein